LEVLPQRLAVLKALLIYERLSATRFDLGNVIYGQDWQCLENLPNLQILRIGLDLEYGPLSNPPSGLLDGILVPFRHRKAIKSFDYVICTNRLMLFNKIPPTIDQMPCRVTLGHYHAKDNTRRLTVIYGNEEVLNSRAWIENTQRKLQNGDV
jgi:hypothetical protein